MRVADMLRVYGLVLLLCCASAMAQTTRPATRPVFPLPTQPATRPATKPNPLATPEGAVKHVLNLIEKGDFASVRVVALQAATVTELRERLNGVFETLQGGSTFTVVDSFTVGAVSSIICQCRNKAGQSQYFLALFAVRRFDDWRVELGAPNMRLMTQEERNGLGKVAEWKSKRLTELRNSVAPGATTAPAQRG